MRIHVFPKHQLLEEVCITNVTREAFRLDMRHPMTSKFLFRRKVGLTFRTMESVVTEDIVIIFRQSRTRMLHK